MSVTSRLRRRLSGSRDARLDGLEALVRKQGRQLARQRSRIDRQQATLARQVDRVDRQAERVVSHRDTVARLVTLVERIDGVLDILGRQLAAVEVRMADLEERSAAPTAAGPGEVDEARSVVAEVRAEHARIRERFGVVTVFEERLRRLEDALAEDTKRTLEEFERTARALAAELETDDPADTASR